MSLFEYTKKLIEPERCDVRRAPKPGEGHLALVPGAHRCLGAALANLESEIALDHLMLQRDSLVRL